MQSTTRPSALAIPQWRTRAPQTCRTSSPAVTPVCHHGGRVEPCGDGIDLTDRRRALRVRVGSGRGEDGGNTVIAVQPAEGRTNRPRSTTEAYCGAMSTPASRSEAPSPLLRIMESRALFEFGAIAAASPLLRVIGRGDNHPVLILPGFLAGDSSTAPLRSILQSQGYWVHGWRLGRNLGPTQDVVDGLTDRLRGSARPPRPPGQPDRLEPRRASTPAAWPASGRRWCAR